MTGTRPITETSSPLHFEFEPNETEFVHVRKIAARRHIHQAIINATIGAALIGMSFLTKSDFLTGAGVVVVGNAIGYPLQVTSCARRFYRQHPQLHPYLSVTVDDVGLRVSSQDSEHLMRWPAFTHYRETDSLFLLFQGPENPGYIPKRCIGEADLPKLRELLDRHIRLNKYMPHPVAFPVEQRTSS